MKLEINKNGDTLIEIYGVSKQEHVIIEGLLNRIGDGEISFNEACMIAAESDLSMNSHVFSAYIIGYMCGRNSNR